jgi:Double-GTPase 2
MLGHSNAGKTTYMAMMYHFMNKGYEGFSITADDPGRHAELLANARAIIAGRYPPPTSHHSEYDFTLSFEGREVSAFTWSDYRGGALMERSTSAETATVLREIASSDAVVIFADAEELVTNRDSHGDVDELVDLMHRAIEERSNAKPLVLAFTKADLIRKTADWAIVLEPFEKVMRAMDTSSNVKGTAVTVACTAKPKAVQVPVLWCLSYALANRAKALHDDVTYYQGRADHHARNDTLTNRIVSWWNSDESEHQKQLRNLARAQEKLAEVLPLERRVTKMITVLAKAQRKEGPPRAFRRAGRR